MYFSMEKMGVILCLCTALSALSLRAEDEVVKIDNTVTPAVETLPDFKLKDPRGGVHTRAEFLGKKIVIVMSVPTKEQGGAQKGWVEGIQEQNSGSEDYSLILVEDMTQSGNRELVMDALKRNWIPGNLPLILVDDTGSFRHSLELKSGLLTNLTALLVYDERGTLQSFDRSKPKNSTKMALK